MKVQTNSWAEASADIIDVLKKSRVDECSPDYYLGWQRYEKVRKLNPAQFADLWKENLTTGVHFDILVDQLPE